MGRTMSNLGNSDVVNPGQAKWGDLDNSERGARVLGGGIKGLGQGLQSMPQQPQMGGGSMAPIQPTAAAPVSSDYFNPQNPMRKPITNNSAFYGGQ
jgi:hypothetical protein